MLYVTFQFQQQFIVTVNVCYYVLQLMFTASERTLAWLIIVMKGCLSATEH